MKLPTKPGSDRVIARDKFRNAILIHRNTCDGGPADGGYDLQTNGRVFLDSRLAKELARKLLDFAEGQERRVKP